MAGPRPAMTADGVLPRRMPHPDGLFRDSSLRAQSKAVVRILRRQDSDNNPRMSRQKARFHKGNPRKDARRFLRRQL
jgi:hypothetical protein